MEPADDDDVVDITGVDDGDGEEEDDDEADGEGENVGTAQSDDGTASSESEGSDAVTEEAGDYVPPPLPPQPKVTGNPVSSFRVRVGMFK